MEPLPRGANFVRAKFMWEIGLHVAGDPNEPYTGNRDVCITVGSGSGEHYRPWLRMSSGSPILAHAVAHGELEMAIVNPSGLLTQAYRGTGLFAKPLPLRVVATYPSWDRYCMLFHPNSGVTSLAQVKERKMPLRISTREDPTHSTRVLIDQILGLYGYCMADIEKWGGSLQTNGGPGDKRRMEAIRTGSVDAVWDEGIKLWFDEALRCGYKPFTLDDATFKALGDIGWRKVVIPARRLYPNLAEDYACIDYSGWPLYAHESLPEEKAYKVVEAIHARVAEIKWDDDNEWSKFLGVGSLGEQTDQTPRDVPLHPGSERWFREHGFKV